jgi:RNA polymerase sigma-70 factor, ECF subfamily
LSGEAVTDLLLAWSAGDESALERLTPLVHQELRRIARGYMRRERPGLTLQTTALVNEAYLKLVNCSLVRWQDRAHFFAVSARVMRRVLVDLARSHQYQKRGAGAQRITLTESLVAGSARGADVLALDCALESLAQFDERKSRVVELKFFGGLTTDEIAQVLQVSPQTVLRDWGLARSWLRREIERSAK